MKLRAILFIVMSSVLCSGQTPRVADPDAPSKITVASKEEPGERLIVSGTVFGDDGVTPLRGVSIYVYHTDIKGHYSEGTTRSDNPRLRGWMRTDREGKYEFDTIKPGPYPASRVPAHIHYVVSAQGYREKIFEIVFEGDQFIDDKIRSDAKKEESAFSIRSLERDAKGGLRCVQDIRLRRQ